MKINIKDTGIADASGVLVDLAAVAQVSAERGDLPTETYAGIFEIVGALANAVQQEAGREA